MPINPSIPLAGRVAPIRVPDFAGIRDRRAALEQRNALVDLQRESLQQQNAFRGQQQAEFEANEPTRRMQRFSARDEARARSMIFGAERLQPFLASGDIAGADAFLTRRQAALDEAGIDSSDTALMRTILATDPDLARQQVEFAIQSGRDRGILQALPKSDPFTLGPGQQRFTPTGEQVAAVAPKSDVRSPEKLAQDIRLAQTQLGAKAESQIEVDRRKREAEAASPRGRLEVEKLEKQIAEIDRKRVSREEKRRLKVDAVQRNSDRIIGTVDDAVSQVSSLSAGFLGSMTDWIGGTPARDLRAKLDTIKGNLGFAELQAMRDASPTGGALGQVAIQELVALQSTIASLDQAQSPDQLRAGLATVREHLVNWNRTVQEGAGGPVDASALDVIRPGASGRFTIEVVE